MEEVGAVNRDSLSMGVFFSPFGLFRTKLNFIQHSEDSSLYIHHCNHSCRLIPLRSLTEKIFRVHRMRRKTAKSRLKRRLVREKNVWTQYREDDFEERSRDEIKKTTNMVLFCKVCFAIFHVRFVCCIAAHFILYYFLRKFIWSFSHCLFDDPCASVSSLWRLWMIDRLKLLTSPTQLCVFLARFGLYFIFIISGRGQGALWWHTGSWYSIMTCLWATLFAHLSMNSSKHVDYIDK